MDVLQCLASLKHVMQQIEPQTIRWDRYWIRFGTTVDRRMRATELVRFRVTSCWHSLVIGLPEIQLHNHTLIL